MAGEAPNDRWEIPGEDDLLDTAASRRYAERMAARAARRDPKRPVTHAGREDHAGRAGRRTPPSEPAAARPQMGAEERVAVVEAGPQGGAAVVAADVAYAPAKQGAAQDRTGRARNTAIFSVLTAFSRVAGLIREVLATAFYGTSGPASAFTIAFQIPNLLRSLFADAALSAAFVPVFTDLLQQGRRRDAMRLAAHMTWVMLLGLSALTAISILLSPVIVPWFTGDLGAADTTLAVHLTQIMFPVVALLGVNGLLVGILNAEDHFTIPALSPVVWNVVIMVFMVATHVALDGPAELYGYAFGVLVGTVAQLAMAIPMVRRFGFSMGPPGGWRDPQVRRVLTLMVPVALGLGLVNFNLVINSTLGFRLDEQVPRAIDAAFRLYMLPQGIFSVAIATVLFPALSRAASRRDLPDLRAIIGGGMRQILVLLVPAAMVTIVLAGAIVRVVYERGAFNQESAELTTEALWIFSLTLPLNGINLLLTRTFFALKQPWTTTALAVLSLLVNLIVSVLLYRPLGIGGIVVGTVAANIAVVAAQMLVLRGRLEGSLELAHTVAVGLRVMLGALLCAAVVWGVQCLLLGALGESFLPTLLVLVVGLPAGGAVYFGALRAMRVGEIVAVERMVRARIGRG